MPDNNNRLSLEAAIPVGMCFGVALGSALGLTVFDNLAIGIGSGMGIGMAMGIAYSQFGNTSGSDAEPGEDENSTGADTAESDHGGKRGDSGDADEQRSGD